jgi:hypothetical protein
MILYKSRPKYNKFRAIKTEVDGIKFDSRREAAHYTELRRLEDVGMITDLVCHPPYLLQRAFIDNQGQKVKNIRYIADFKYNSNGIEYIEDVKGMRTKEYILKRKLMLFMLKDKPKTIFREIK